MTRWDLSGAVWRKSSHSGEQGGECIEVAAVWRRSSHSADQGGTCVEVAAVWRKSSLSGGEGGECIEVAPLVDGQAVAVRDSKNPNGAVLVISTSAWQGLLNTIKATD